MPPNCRPSSRATTGHRGQHRQYRRRRQRPDQRELCRAADILGRRREPERAVDRRQRHHRHISRNASAGDPYHAADDRHEFYYQTVSCCTLAVARYAPRRWCPRPLRLGTSSRSDAHPRIVRRVDCIRWHWSSIAWPRLADCYDAGRSATGAGDGASQKEPAICDGSQSGRKRQQGKSIRGCVMCCNSHTGTFSRCASAGPLSARQRKSRRA